MSHWNEAERRTNHSALMATANNATLEQCNYVIRDAQAALEAMPDGHKASHYADEICYYGARRAALNGKR